MTHPPSAPSQPPRPSGPREPITPLDPDSPEGRQAAAAMSEFLAEIELKVRARRRNNSSKRHNTDAA